MMVSKDRMMGFCSMFLMQKGMIYRLGVLTACTSRSPTIHFFAGADEDEDYDDDDEEEEDEDMDLGYNPQYARRRVYRAGASNSEDEDDSEDSDDEDDDDESSDDDSMEQGVPSNVVITELDDDAEVLSTSPAFLLPFRFLLVGRIYLGIREWSRYTPSLWTGNV
jgi:hypothetical protein